MVGNIYLKEVHFKSADLGKKIGVDSRKNEWRLGFHIQ